MNFVNSMVLLKDTIKYIELIPWEVDSRSAAQILSATCETLKFITVTTRSRHFTLSWAR
jgi:hypothetical protein